MLFTSTTFLFVFLPVTLLLYYLLPGKKTKNIILLILSLIFYAWGEPLFVFVMLLSIIMNWLFGYLVGKTKETNRSHAKLIVGISVFFNLIIIFIFKYLNFTVDNLNAVLGTDIAIRKIALPIGISFFTFQALSYVIDVYRGHGAAQKNPLNVGLYISFFPQLIAGPIVRYETVAEQINNREESLDKFSEGVSYFIRGFCRKILLANNIALVADRAFGLQSTDMSVGFAWLGALAYTFQIYFDFHGYSEMAIGLGKMFGFDFLPNFNYPYISTSVSEFWRRWHMSLGTWFRDYVYFPLGGSRVKNKGRLIFNLFVVWALTGVWHGANWTFICWGLMYFVLLTIEKLIGFEKKANQWFFKIFKYVYTALFVVLGWVIFRSDSIGQAYRYIKVMFGIGKHAGTFDYLANFYLLEYGVYFLLCMICSVPVAALMQKALIQKESRVTDAIKYVFYAICFIISITFVVKGAYNPFIYFNF
ncbi:MAG: MBOAT family protein [Lachnospiraceae bacterium]|nr:MBOAT family protein [Lachnospiraceae bacterium]